MILERDIEMYLSVLENKPTPEQLEKTIGFINSDLKNIEKTKEILLFIKERAKEMLKGE